MTSFELIVIFLCAWFFTYLRLSSVVWSLWMGVILGLSTIYCGFSHSVIITLWVIWGIIAVFTNMSWLRRMVFSGPFFSRFKKILPPLSSTEREALEAGDVWWEGDIFAGNPNWDKLHAIPKPHLTAEEQEFLNNETEELCRMLNDWTIVQENTDLPAEVWQYLKDKGFFGLVISKEYGGKGFSAIAHSTVVTKIATRSMSAAITAMVPNSLGPGELIAHYGTDEQKKHYLPRLAKGLDVPCFALTSTHAGSDAGAMIDSGVLCRQTYQGEEVVGIRLSWSKRYITLAPVATVLGLAFKLYDPDHILGPKTDIGITVALLPANHPGVQIGKRHYPMGLAFMNGPTEGKDVFIPLDFVVGGPKMLGKGWRMLMECLSIGRGISLPALGAAVGRLSYLTTGIYAQLRKQFKVPLNAFEGVQESLAKIAGYTYMLEASRRMTAGAVDLKVKPSVASAIQKYHATELARVISDASMDVHSGRAIQLGERNYLGNQYAAIPIAITVEGANILTRNLIIYGQGAIRCHPYVLQEMEAAADTDLRRGVRRFDRVLKAHIGYTMSNVVRAFTMGLTNAAFVKARKEANLAYYYRQLTRMSNALSICSDFAMLSLGGQLKRKERLSARLGDVLSALYLSTATLKYFVDEGSQAEDLPYVQWVLETNLHKCQTAFYDFFDNFPSRLIAHFLRGLIFPYGTAYKKPSDSLESRIVSAMTKPSTLRDRMTQYVYAPLDATDPVGRMRAAFESSLVANKIERKLQEALKTGSLTRVADRNAYIAAAVKAGVITPEESIQLHNTAAQILDAMEVDSFSPQTLRDRSFSEKEV